MNTINLLALYETMTDMHTEYYGSRTYTSIFPSNAFTAFYFHVPKLLGATQLSDVTINLVDAFENKIDFKSIIPANDLVFANGYLTYKNTGALTQSLEGLYYLEITDGIRTYYTNKVLFGVVNIEYQAASVSISYNRVAAIDPLEITITTDTTKQITIEWGDENQDSFNVTTSGYTFSHSYSDDGEYTVKITDNLQNIKELHINNSGVSYIFDIENLTNIEVLNLENCTLSSIEFSKIYTLKEFYAANSNIAAIFGIEQSPIEIIDLSYCPRAQAYFLDNNRVSKLTSLKKLTIENCFYSNIVDGVIAGSNGGNNIDDLIEINAAYNNFSNLISLGVGQGGGDYENLLIYDMSFNNLIGNPVNSMLTANNKFFIYNKKYDFSYNNLNVVFVDNIIEKVATLNNDKSLVDIDFRGYSKVNNLNNASPTLGILTATIVSGGTGYAINDTIEPTDGGGSGCVIKVTNVSAGVITAISITSKGQGYTSIPTTFTTSGSGINANLTLKTGKIIITDVGGVVNHN